MPDVLALAPEWIALAAVPAIIGLVAAGYIRSFKGFGVEIEAALYSPLGVVSLTASEVTPVEPAEKGSVTVLEEMPEVEKLTRERLSFINKEQGFYDSSAVMDYLSELPNLKYLEIVDEHQSFLHLLPVDILMQRSLPSRERISDFRHSVPSTERITDFIQSVQEGTSASIFRDSVITGSVRLNTPLVNVLEKLKATSNEYLPAIDRGKMIGVVTREAVERRLAEEVLVAHKRL